MKVLHTGHIGDIIAFLPLYKAVNGKKLFVRDDPGMEPMSGFKYNTMEPLLLNQGIDVSFTNCCNGVDIDMTHWRAYYKDHISLTSSQARLMGLVNPSHGVWEYKEPWIDVEPDLLTKGRVIFNRTPRYRNPVFPWKEVHNHFGDRALFVGTPAKHELYEKEVAPIERYETSDCLAVARAIKGSDYFVGNQSSSFWIAAAMFHPLLQETFPYLPNSIVPYDRANYCTGPNIDFDSL
jgi:hypothetical protein